MRELGLAIEGWILIGCVWALLVICLAVLGVQLVRYCKVWRRQRAFLIMTGLALEAIIVGGTKPSKRPVNFPRTDIERPYLIDAGSFVSNDVVHVDFTTFLIPDTAPVILAYWPNESTNEAEMVEYINQPLSAWQRPLDFEIENAISNRWYCYTTWTPGPVVHTNGVWQQTGMTEWRNHRDTILIRTIIIEDGEPIAPPHFENETEGDDIDE